MPTFSLTCVLLLMWGGGTLPLPAQMVPAQANTDAQAQRQLQTEAQESSRRRRIKENIRLLVAVLDPSILTGPTGPAQTLQAMAALADLLNDNMNPGESLEKAMKKSSINPSVTQKTSAYILQCWNTISDKISREDLPGMRQGREPDPPLHLPPFQP